MTLAKHLDNAAAARTAFDASLDRLNAQRDASPDTDANAADAFDDLIGGGLRRAFDDLAALRPNPPARPAKPVVIDLKAERST
jgi:hypothetical protein